MIDIVFTDGKKEAYADVRCVRTDNGILSFYFSDHTKASYPLVNIRKWREY
jgi:hypothetical protein